MLTRAPRDFARPTLPGLTRAPSKRVLVDLSHAADGYVGVAQDLRLVFSMLCGIDMLSSSGLLMAAGRHDLPRVHPKSANAAALTAAVLHWMERNWRRPEHHSMPLGLLQKIQTGRQLIRLRHQLLPMADASQLNAIWRVIFAKTLPPEQRELVLSVPYFATDLSVSSIIDLCVHSPIALRKRLAAEHFDAVLFSMPRPVKLPRGVRQIVRFHDAVPVTDTDTVGGWKIGLAHSKLIRACDRDAIFVCNSPQSRQTLLGLDPDRERNAVVIPCAVAPVQRNLRGIEVRAVIERHLTFRALGPGPRGPEPGWSPPPANLRYVLSVSTIEPRKNFAGLVRGWERVVARSDPDLRLVIVGEAGWRESQALAEMRPGVASGHILHLQHLPQEDLQALMHGAACFALPSFNEGFGYTPLEALQAGAPCLVSDLPVFRWIFGDCVLYVDPYDTESIAAGIERLTSRTGWQNLGACFGQGRERVLSRFRTATVAKAWEDLLLNL